MQQTEQYKLNLIEPSDPFLPEGLNANTQKIEDAMAAHEAAVDGRLIALEGHHICAGAYRGTGSHTSQFITLPFTPSSILVFEGGSVYLYTEGGYQHSYITVGENGFTVAHSLNQADYRYYIAFC